MRRQGRPQYPPEALREALVNALCHRDYSEAGASVGVAIFDDRIEVWSWDRLPGDLTPEKLSIDHPSVRRNELQSPTCSTGAATSRSGDAEQIIELCRRAGLRDPDFLERGRDVGVRFWAADRTVTAAEAGDLLPRQREVSDAVASLGMATLQEIRERFHNPPGVRMIQQLLAALVENGRVVRAGKGRLTRYRPAG